MSTQPNLQQFPTAPGGEGAKEQKGPAAGEKAQERKERLIKSTRVEFGFFLRKKVDGRVVREWQFPPFKRQAELKVQPPPVPPADAPAADQQAADEPVMQVQALTLDPTSGGGGAPSSEESTTTYEGGLFFRTESVTPPDWDGGGAVEPPKSG
jgi:hypothetical protein